MLDIFEVNACVFIGECLIFLKGMFGVFVGEYLMCL